MINFYGGRTGGGKTYETVRYIILPALLEDKRMVVTNVSLQVDYICQVHGEEYRDLIKVVEAKFTEYGTQRPFSKVEDFTDWNDWRNEKGQGPLFVVDEAHLSLGRQSKVEVHEYFSLHRHYGHDILLLSQNSRKLHRDVKDLVEVAFVCIKKSVFGDDEGYIRKTYHGLGDLKNHVNLEHRVYESPYFKYFKSHTMTESSVQESTAPGTQAVLNPYKKATYIAFGISALVMFYAVSRVFSGPAQAEPKSVAQIVKASEEQEITGVPSTDSGPDIPETKPMNVNPQQSVNDDIEDELVRRSKLHHPFSKVSLHVDGSYEDQITREVRHYFSASQNGQRLFSLTLRDFYMAGYDVKVYGDCVVEITYFEYRDFLTCDVPTVGVNQNSTAVAKN